MKSRSDRKRHKWREVSREDYETVRQCVVCDLRKITDHTAHPPMTYYLEKGSTYRLIFMPECEAVA